MTNEFREEGHLEQVSELICGSHSPLICAIPTEARFAARTEFGGNNLLRCLDI